jgi:hypothetical protein
MRHHAVIFVMLTVLAIALVAGCGGGSESDEPAESAVVNTMPVEGAPFGDVIAAAGYQVIQFRDFPAQLPGRKCFAVVYRKGSTGGVLYTGEQGNSGDRSVWHWYFTSDAPDSVTYVELNDDGLWDVRMFVGDEHVDYLQESDFSFFGRPRSDLIAMNGTASSPEGMWQAFDSDSTTSWMVDGDDGWVEVYSPFGLRDGVLTVQLGRDGAARKVEVKADGKKVSTFDLDATRQKQVLKLGEGAMKATTLRLEFSGGKVEIAEIAIR